MARWQPLRFRHLCIFAGIAETVGQLAVVWSGFSAFAVGDDVIYRAVAEHVDLVFAELAYMCLVPQLFAKSVIEKPWLDLNPVDDRIDQLAEFRESNFRLSCTARTS